MPLKTEERGRVRVYACRSSACDNNNKAWLLRCFNAAISALLDAILVFFFLLTHLCCLLALSLCCLTLAPVSVFLSPLTLSCPFFLLFSVFFFFLLRQFHSVPQKSKTKQTTTTTLSSIPYTPTTTTTTEITVNNIKKKKRNNKNNTFFFWCSGVFFFFPASAAHKFTPKKAVLLLSTFFSSNFRTHVLYYFLFVFPCIEVSSFFFFSFEVIGEGELGSRQRSIGQTEQLTSLFLLLSFPLVFFFVCLPLPPPPTKKKKTRCIATLSTTSRRKVGHRGSSQYRPKNEEREDNSGQVHESCSIAHQNHSYFRAALTGDVNIFVYLLFFHQYSSLG